MIKRIIACFTICLIITGIISPVFSDASALPQPNWSDPGISEIINISDLTGWMLNGGTFDVSQYTNAESFMNDYFNARTKTRLVSPGENAEDYYEVLPGFGINNQLVAGESFARPLETNRVIASSFRDHTGYGRRLSNEVNEALLSSGSLYDTKIPLLNEVEFANFVGYNHDALRLYSEFFNEEDPVPTPNPDPNYQQYIDKLNNNYNGYGFFWYDFPLQLGNYTNNYYPAKSISYVGIQYSGTTIMQINTPQAYTAQHVAPCTSILTLNITGSGSNYIGTIDSFTQKADWLQWNNYMYGVIEIVKSGNSYSWGNYSSGNHNNYVFNSQTRTGTLDDVLQWFSTRFRNINVYVNGDLWALAGDPPINPTITPEFPDAVGGDELPNTTWPISRPRAPYYTSIPGMLQAIEDAIQGDGVLDIDDLKPYLTDYNGDPVPDPIFDPEPVPIPVPDPVNPDIVPGLPVLPAIPPDMPGFNGVSVLAEIINFTNQSLPTSLIVTFWGIVFGIVILGLIKILHK